MVLKVERKKVKGGKTEIYVFDDRAPKDKRLTYIIDNSRNKIEFYPKPNEFFTDKIIIEGFKDLPDEFYEKGYIKGGALYYLNKKFSDTKPSKVTISRTKRNNYRKYGKHYQVLINYDSFQELTTKLTAITTAAKADRSQFADLFFYELFPLKFEKPENSAAKDAKQLMSTIDARVIKELSAEDINKLIEFLGQIIKERFSSKQHKNKLLTLSKLKMDDIAINEVISEFKKMLKENPPESKWGKFLERNLFLLDSKYIHSIPEINVILGGQRKADFGLIDTQGYMDIFEIKKPQTKLLAAKEDRGNYYWSTDAIKAITQIEKYLHNAERKGANLAEDIKREKGKEVKVVKPRAYLIIGKYTDLKSENEREDFRILRRSLKNIEIITYDELLDRIEAQKGKIYLD